MGYKDLTNQTFGGITALERDVDLSEQKHRGWWKCRCNYCGKEVYYPTDRLQKGPYSCGCVKKPRYNFVDETGNTYGRLTVISRNTEKHSKSGAYWNCHCECGGTIVVDTYSLHCGSTVSCGCKSREFYKYTPKKMKDETGNRYGALTVLERNYEHAKDSTAWWTCLCECGNLVVCRGTALRAGYNLSCGCKRRYRGETAIANLLTDKSISYKTQQTFEDFRFSKTNGVPRFDFGIYSEDKLIFLIEYNGIQHYQYVEYFQESTEDICARDQEKVRYCQIHNIPLEIIPYTEFDNLPEIIDRLLEKYQIKGGS